MVNFTKEIPAQSPPPSSRSPSLLDMTTAPPELAFEYQWANGDSSNSKAATMAFTPIKALRFYKNSR